ncbi:MAG TPA: (5-formylfuran-3-yl)methyl phosphate synthase [Burkholderiaceae bacterium]|nr:(5-formylfuran-3-yl)methyl phosphate synthase [Burkholderiaceae bacterium]
MMRLLVSVRSVDEALLAAGAGADFIDLKEPGLGALGGLPVASIAAIVAALRRQRITLPVSATIGDLPMHELSDILARVNAVAACGVDYVKVGITRDRPAGAVLDGLAHCGAAMVPVFIADRGLDGALVARAAALGFPALMADTADKHAGSLFDVVPVAVLRRFVAAARAAGALVGLAGALQRSHAAALAELAPDFAGFRSAVCLGGRSQALDASCLRDLVDTMRQVAPA